MEADAFGELWSQAVESYIAATGRSDGEKSTLAAIHDLEELLARVERENDGFSAFREKHAKLRRILTMALQPVMLAASAAGALIENSPFAPARVIMGAATLLVNSAHGVSRVYDGIEKLFSDLGSFTRRLQEYAQTNIGNSLRHNLVMTLACLLQILGRSECVIKEGRWKRFGQLLVLGEDAKVKALFTELAKLLDEEQGLVGAISYRLHSDIGIKTEEVVETTTATLEVLRQSESERQSEAQQALIDQHFVTPAFRKNTTIYHEYSETTLKSSGEWLIAEPAFQHWLSRNSRFLFVQGLPGAGKSYLSAITVGKIRSAYLQGTARPRPVCVAYFYVKEHDQALQDLENVLKSISYQISRADADFRTHLLGVLQEPEATATPRGIWANVLSGFFSRPDLPNSAMIVLDGLDEAPRQMLKDLFSLLEASARTDSVRISLALFAWPEIAEHFQPRVAQDLSKINIGDKNKGDIAVYIKEHITEIMVVRLTMEQQSRKAAIKLARHIRYRIMAKVDGMFFKAVLIMNELYGKETASAVYASIEASPPKLDAMIAHAFERLLQNDDVDKEHLRELLVWVCAAKRPLTIAELYATLKKRTGKPYDAIEVRLRGKFASIFKLSRRSIGSDSNGDEETGAAPTRSSTFDFDIDDDDGLENSDDEDEWSGTVNTGGDDESQAADSAFETAPLNAETLERFWSTEVTFSHSSIRQFLVEGGREADTAKFGLAVDVNAAEAHVICHLLQRLRHGFRSVPNSRSSPNCDYFDYAASFFLDHLMSVDMDKLPDEELQNIVQQICKLFLQCDAMTTLVEATASQLYANKMLHYLFERPEFPTVLRTRWLTRAREDMHTREELQWIQASVCRRAELFRPLAMQCARLWLEETGQEIEHHDRDYLSDRYQMYLVWIVHCFLETVSVFSHWAPLESADQTRFQEKAEDDSEPRNLNIGRLTALYSPELDEDSIRKLAEFVPVETTARRHTSLGWLLYKSLKYSSAASEYRKATELDANSWRALEGLGLCLIQEEKYEEAISLLRKALSKAPAALPGAPSAIQWAITDAAVSQGDFRTARDLARRVLDTNKLDLGMVDSYVRALYGLGDLPGIVSFVKELQGSMPAGQTIHSNMFRGVDAEVGRALRSQNALSLIQSAIKASLEPGPKALDFATYPWRAVWIAEFMYSFYDDVDDSEALFERILSPQFRESLPQHLKWAYDFPSQSARQHLSRIYYDKAVEAHASGANPEQWVAKLRDLVGHVAEAEEALRKYLRRYPGADRSEWKQYYKREFSSILASLGDGDRTDGDRTDTSWFCFLTRALLSAGDVAGAAAGAVFLTASVPDGSPFQAALREAGLSGAYCACDGLCNTWAHTYRKVYEALYFCTECYDTAFCEECYPLLKSGALPFRRCSAKHELLQLLPMSEDAKAVAVTFDGSSVKLSVEWLNRLKEEWC